MSFLEHTKGKTRDLKLTNHSYQLFKAPLAETLERLHLQSPMRYLFSAIVVSTSVQLVLLPFQVVYFHRLSLASFLLNIPVSLLIAGVSLTAVAGLAMAQFSAGLAAPFFEVANALNWLMIHSVDPFEQAGVASLRLPEYTGWPAGIYALYYLPLLMLARGMSRWRPLRLALRNRSGWLNSSRSMWLAAIIQLLAVAIVVGHPWSVERPNGNLRIDFLDVGQGDAALLTLPDGVTILVDGGGQPGPFTRTLRPEEEDGLASIERKARGIGESVTSEYLWWRGLDHVDYLVATHADADHMDGLNDVARNFDVRAALVARNPIRDPEYATFARTLAAKSIPVRLIGSGDELQIGEVLIRVLWPPSSASSQLSSQNNDSLVLQVKYKDRSILLTGDIEVPAEMALLRSHAGLKADLVKVAHHGSILWTNLFSAQYAKNINNASYT